MMQRFTRMIVSLSGDAIVEAERAGAGRLPWAWVLLCCETAAVVMRSEPMFRTRAAALRVGGFVMAGQRARGANLIEAAGAAA